MAVTLATALHGYTTPKQPESTVLDKSSYGVQSFFSNKSQLEKLKKISSGFCPPTVKSPKTHLSVKDPEGYVYWSGYETCPDGRSSRRMHLKRIDNETFEAIYNGDKAIMSRTRGNKYTGKNNDYHLMLTIDIPNKSLDGIARIRINSGLGIFVNTFTLGLAHCRIHLKLDEG